MSDPSVRLSLKERMALLSQSGGGEIVLPQLAGTSGPRLVSRESSSSHDQVDRAKSEASLTGGGGSSQSLMSPTRNHAQSERSLTSPAAEESEHHDKFDVDSTMNAAALSRPIMTAGRRRPSRVENFVAAIPVENRLSEKDLAAAVDESRAVGSGRMRQLEPPPAELSATEQWLLARITEYQERIITLEQETAALREALIQANIPVAPKSAPPPSSTASTPVVQNIKNLTPTSAASSATPPSPVMKKTVAPALPVKRSESTEFTSSLKRMSSDSAPIPSSPNFGSTKSNSVESPSGPARKVPATLQGPRAVPSIPPSAPVPSTAPVTEPVTMPRIATEPVSEASTEESEGAALPKETTLTKEEPLEEEPVVKEEDEDVDSELEDML